MKASVLFWIALLSGMLLAGCSPNFANSPPPPLLPPLPTAQSPVTDALRALGGEWRLVSVDDRPTARPQALIVWGPAFSYGAGCKVASGQLRDTGQGRFAIERYGMRPSKCARYVPPPPFAGAQMQASPIGETNLVIEAGGRKWVFAKVDVTATIARDEFVRGEWLLANAKGEPYRGSQLTRITFDDGGYKIEAPHCSYQENGWIADRDWIVRPGGDQAVQSLKCNTTTPGDKLARLGANVRFTAEPVEARMRVRIGSQAAILVPSARFPELIAGAGTFAANPWALRLAETNRATYDGSETPNFVLRAIGLADLPDAPIRRENTTDVRRQAFAGLTLAQYLAAQEQGVIPSGDNPPTSLRQHLASAPIVVLAKLEGIRPIDRGDGLSLDYLYRVQDAWRGDRRQGDLIIVRMPPLIEKSRSPLITPEPGTTVLLLASRTGYLFGRLIEGKPPSADPRVVAMTLPLMRVQDGKLVEAVADSDLFSAASFDGTSLNQARTVVRAVDTAIAAVKGPAANGRRYFVARIGGRELPDPTLLWFDFDPELKIAKQGQPGGVTRYSHGCIGVVRSGDRWFAPDVGCPSANVDKDDQRLLVRAVSWIEMNGLNESISIGGGGSGLYPPIVVLMPEAEIELRPMLE